VENAVDGERLTQAGIVYEGADVIVDNLGVEFESHAESVCKSFEPSPSLAQLFGVGSNADEPNVTRWTARALGQGLHEGRPLHTLHYIDVDDVNQRRVGVQLIEYCLVHHQMHEADEGHHLVQTKIC